MAYGEQIVVKPEIKEKLKNMKLVDEESYGGVVSRLVTFWEENKK